MSSGDGHAAVDDSSTPFLPSDASKPASGGAEPNPDDDARSALLTLRQYVLADLTTPQSAAIKSWSELDAYISDLCSHGIDTLTREPDTLSSESARLRAQLEEVSCSNYRALIESFECAGAVRDGVGSIRAGLDKLIDDLPPLSSATREFSATAAKAQNEREARLRTLAEFGRVMDILEMPRLMRSLVAGELYEEALELYDTSMKFALTHDDDQVLRSVCLEVDALTRQMILQLVSILRGQVQLPMCLRVVGFLRRLGVFSESRLRMLFLQCRGEWMRSSLDMSLAPNPQTRLVRLSDETRSMMFEIITQYRAAFADDEDEGGAGSFVVGESLSFGEESEGCSAVPTSSILFHWTASCTQQYLTRLEDGLQDVRDGASLSTVMQQAIYCGQSLGRVGADFRSALAPLFEKAVLRIVNSQLNSALRQFEMMVEDNRWSPVGSSALRKDRMRGTSNASPQSSPVRGAAEDEGEGMSAGQICEATVGKSGPGFEPPIAVLDSPPLAVFLNGILAALNEVRACALLSLSTVIASKIAATLESAAECVNTVAGPGGAFLKHSDRPHFLSMRSSLRDLCVPHVARCVDRCMDQRGLVDVGAILEKMEEIFGQSSALSEELFTDDLPAKDDTDKRENLDGLGSQGVLEATPSTEDKCGTVVI